MPARRRRGRASRAARHRRARWRRTAREGGRTAPFPDAVRASIAYPTDAAPYRLREPDPPDADVDDEEERGEPEDPRPQLAGEGHALAGGIEDGGERRAAGGDAGFAAGRRRHALEHAFVDGERQILARIRDGDGAGRL